MRSFIFGSTIALILAVLFQFTAVLNVQAAPDEKAQNKTLAEVENVSCDPQNVDRCLNEFAWKEFLALQAKPSGPLDNTCNPEAETIWQTYCRPEQVFLADDIANPRSLSNANDSDVVDFLANAKDQPAALNAPVNVAVNVSTEDGITQPGPEALQYPLVDQESNYVLYEIHMSPDQVQQIKENHWNDRKCLEKYSKSNPFQFSTTDENGQLSISEIKAAWRIFDDNTQVDKSKYYTTRRSVFIPGSYLNPRTTEGKNVTLDLGLIGFHIAHKVSDLGDSEGPQWVWATFEHQDNTPLAEPVPNQTYTLYNPKCLDCQPNQFEGKNGSYFNLQGFPSAVDQTGQPIKPTQTKRLLTQQYSGSAIEMNNQYSQGTPWQNYKLIGVQWQLNPLSPGMLGNPALETYIPERGQSCFACHRGAKLPNSSTSADFSFLPKRAKLLSRDTCPA